MEFSSFSSFHHTPHSTSHYIWYTRSMSNATLFDVFFSGFGSRHRFSFLDSTLRFLALDVYLLLFDNIVKEQILKRKFSMKNRAIR